MGDHQHSFDERWRRFVAGQLGMGNADMPANNSHQNINSPEHRVLQNAPSSSLHGSNQDNGSFLSTDLSYATPASSLNLSQAGHLEPPQQYSTSGHIAFDSQLQQAIQPNNTGGPFDLLPDWQHQIASFGGSPSSVQDSAYGTNQFSDMGNFPAASQPKYQHAATGQLTEEFEACAKEAVEHWAALQVQSGQDPFTRPFLRYDIAEMFNIPIGMFVWFITNMSKTMPPIPSETTASRTTSPGYIPTAVMSPERKGVYKRKLADDFVKQARNDRCTYRKPTPAAAGKTFKCIHRGCDSSHERADDWKRHCLRAWPVEVYVCDLCLNQDNPKTKVLVTHWKDRLRQHIAKEHSGHDDRKSMTGLVSDIVDSSRMPVPDADGFEMTCDYRAPGSRRACNQHIRGIKNCLDHCQSQHFGPEHSASSGKDAASRHGHNGAADTGSKRSRGSAGSVGKKRKQ